MSCHVTFCAPFSGSTLRVCCKQSGAEPLVGWAGLQPGPFFGSAPVYKRTRKDNETFSVFWKERERNYWSMIRTVSWRQPLLVPCIWNLWKNSNQQARGAPEGTVHPPSQPIKSVGPPDIFLSWSLLGLSTKIN